MNIMRVAQQTWITEECRLPSNMSRWAEAISARWCTIDCGVRCVSKASTHATAAATSPSVQNKRQWSWGNPNLAVYCAQHGDVSLHFVNNSTATI